MKLSVSIGSTEMELNGDATNGRIPYDFNVLLEHDFKLYAIQICNVVNWGRLQSPMWIEKRTSTLLSMLLFDMIHKL